MSFSPISFIASNYRDYKNNWLKAYEPGTTTPKSMATDSTLLVLIAKAELNKDGFIISAGGALIIPYIDGAYDLWLFPTEAEADANDTSNALRLADNITGVSATGSTVNSLTLNSAKENTELTDGDSVNISGRNTSGDGGGAMWDVVAIGTVTPNTYWIVAHDTLPLALVLRETSTYNLSAYGVAGVDAVNDTAAWLSAIARLVVKGGGSLVQNHDLLISATAGQTLSALDGLESISHDTNGHKIRDVKTDWVDGETFELYTLKNIGYTGFSVVSESQPSILINEPIQADKVPKVGMRTINFLEGCGAGLITIDQVGGERAVAFGTPSLGSFPKSEFSGNMTLNITTLKTHYPIRATGNGRNLTVNLSCEDVGRSWYIYGDAHNITVNASTKNNIKTGLVAAFGGLGASGITIVANNKETTTFAPSTPYASIRFGDTTPASFTDIDIQLDIKALVGAGWSGGIELSKFDSGVPDTVGRGHTIDGLKLSGVIDFSASTGATTPLLNTGDFLSPDSISGINIDGLKLLGGTSTWQLNDSLTGSASIKNLDSDSSFRILHSTGKSTFTGAKAIYLTNNDSDESDHTYIDCVISSDANQSLINKTFINTLLAGVLTNSYAPNLVFEGAIMTRLDGDLSTPINLLQVKQNQLRIEIEYYGVQDRFAGTRVEAYGTISRTATVDSSGNWGGYQSQAQVVAEQLMNSPSPAFAIGLSNGDATDGGFVNISSPTFNDADGRYVFKVRIISLNTKVILKQL